MKKKKIWLLIFVNILIFVGCFIVTNTKIVGIVNYHHHYHLFIKHKNYKPQQQIVVSRNNKYIVGTIIADNKTSSDKIHMLKENKNNKELNYIIRKNRIEKNMFLIQYRIYDKINYIKVSKSEINGILIYIKGDDSI